MSKENYGIILVLVSKVRFTNKEGVLLNFPNEL